MLVEQDGAVIKNAVTCINLDEMEIMPERTSFFGRQIYLVKMTSLFPYT